ncbi:MAG: AsmA family protein [Verrucomicrobiia bacterium]
MVKAIKVILIIVGVVMALAIILVGAGIYFTSRYLQTPSFKEQALRAAHQELGADVQIDDLKVSLFSGVELRGVTIGNPPGFPGNLVTANAFVLRYRLLPLLSRRVEIEELSLDKPVITLSQNDKGGWNYEEIGAPVAETKTNAAVSTPPAPATTKAERSVPVDIVLSKLAITQGALSMVSDSNKPLVKLDGISFSCSVSLIGNKLAGSGKGGIDKIDLSEKLFVEKVATLVQLESDRVALQSLRGELAGGTISGEVSVNFDTGLEYTVSVQLTNSDVARLLQDAGAKQAISGKLNVTTSLAGTGGVPTIIGNGRVEIDNGKLMEVPLLNLLASLLQIDALRDVSFDQCLVEYSISNNVMQTPVVRLTSPQVQIAGKGFVSLDKYTLHHNMRLTFAKGALDGALPGIRDLFTEQPDGSLTLDFKVTGPYNSPKTDLAKRLGQQLLQKGLQQLFSK